MTGEVERWIERLGLQPHPEGGYFKENYRADDTVGGTALPERYGAKRSLSTAIYYLLGPGDFSAFHRLRSDETCHFYAGCSLTLHVIAPDGSYACPRLGLNLDAGDRPQQLVARDQWFAAEPVEPDGFTLAGCTVAPGFDMTDFELAERDALTHAYPAHTELIARLTRTGASP